MSVDSAHSKSLSPRYLFYCHRKKYALGALVLLVSNALAFLIPWLSKHAVDDLSAGQVRTIHIYAACIVATAIVQALMRVVSRFIIFGVGREVEMEVRQKIFEKLQNYDASFFQRHPSGELSSLITNDSNVVRLFFGMGVLNLINGTLLYLMGSVLIFALNVELALWALLPYVAMIFILRKVTPKFHAYNRLLQEEMGTLTEFMQENVGGQEVLRCFGQQDPQTPRFGARNLQLLNTMMGLTKVRGVLFTTTGALAGLGTFILLGVGGRQVIEGAMSLGEFVAFSGYLGLLVTPTLMFGFVISIWHRGQASLERIRDWTTEASLVEDLPANPEHVFAGDIRIEDLSFSYPAAESRLPTLKSVSLHIPQGRLTAVVGPIGSGKSTLASLFFKLYPLERGKIFWGADDLADQSASDLRRSISLAAQDSFLFSASIAENIQVGLKLGANSPTSEQAPLLEAAFLKAQLQSNQKPMALSLHSRVGEKGVMVSGGQRQRIGLARVIVNPAPLIILDEPFASLDVETAHHVLQEFEQLLPEHSILLITHHMALAKRASHIIVMDRGEVVGEGVHENLIKENRVYRDLTLLESYA